MFAAAITFPNQHCFVICKANYTQVQAVCQGPRCKFSTVFCQAVFAGSMQTQIKPGYSSGGKQEPCGLWYNKALKKFAMIHG